MKAARQNASIAGAAPRPRPLDRLPFLLLAMVLWLASGLPGLEPGAAMAGEPAPELLGKFGEPGTGAGQLEAPGGIAADPNKPGHVFVADRGNGRIDEFTAWGEFVKAWGWGVADGTTASLQTCGPGASPPTAECHRGLSGGGAGELDEPTGLVVDASGIAVDASGGVYVTEGFQRGINRGVPYEPQSRLVKFDEAGHFVWMVGGGVDQGPHHPGNLCTATYVAEGDVCGAGAIGTGPGEFGEWGSSLLGNNANVAVGANGTVYVLDTDRIEEFEPDGSFKGEIPLPQTASPGALAVDPVSGDLYYALALSPYFARNAVFRITQSGESLAPLAAENASALATDAEGNLYVAEAANEIAGDRGLVARFNPAGQRTATFGYEERRPASSSVAYDGLTTNLVGDVYVTNAHGERPVAVYGPPPIVLGPPPSVPPNVTESFASSVGSGGAVVEAEINPGFWSDTRYRVQYGTGACAAGGCVESPAAPGALLTSRVVNAPMRTAGVYLGDLLPGTVYHYRFVAESGGGGPVYGPENAFTTFPAPSASSAACGNEGVRLGSAAFLADCRGYELVSPVDKAGGEITTLVQINSFPAAFDQAAGSGEQLTYSSYKAFGDAQSAPYSSQYLARRTDSGWFSEDISPPREGVPLGTPPQDGLDTMFHGFTGELEDAFLVQNTEPVLAAGAVAGYPELYRRDDRTGGFEALTPGLATPSYIELEGFTPNGRCVIFTSTDRLARQARSGLKQLYESCEGAVTLIGILPNGIASASPSSAGTEGTGAADRSSSVAHAISNDGSKVFWSEGSMQFVRLGAERTVAASKEQATFWGAAADGARAVYTTATHQLYVFDVESQTETPIASGVQGVVGMSEDASRIYFVSTEALAGGNAGEPNLYLDEEGGITYIATLGAKEGELLNGATAYTLAPWRHAARVTPDGEVVAFTASGKLTSYDNTDASSGEPDTEVYVYDARTGGLHCVSCDPSGARPAGRRVKLTGTWVAAQVPGFQSQLYGSHVLSDNGRRMFFDSYAALTPQDTNGSEDVYEWETPGEGSCSTESSSYHKVSGGCVTLISTGESPGGSQIVDASANGSNVFFTTGESLVPQDPGLIDIYDARIDGGFPPYPAPPAACEGEACQAPANPPQAPTPASAIFRGPGNITRRPAKEEHKHKRSRHRPRRGHHQQGRSHRDRRDHHGKHRAHDAVKRHREHHDQRPRDRRHRAAKALRGGRGHARSRKGRSRS